MFEQVSSYGHLMSPAGALCWGLWKGGVSCLEEAGARGLTAQRGTRHHG